MVKIAELRSSTIGELVDRGKAAYGVQAQMGGSGIGFATGIRGTTASKAISTAEEVVTNPVPNRLARVIPENINAQQLGRAEDIDVFVTAAVINTGARSRVRLISPSDNRGAGSSIGHQLRGLPDGTFVKIIPLYNNN